MNENPYRISRDVYFRRKKEFIKNYKDTAVDWSDWSLKEQAIKEIIFRTLIKALEDVDCICWSYVIETTQLPERVIKDLLFITSGAFSWECYNDECIDWILEKLNKDGETVFAEIKAYSEKADEECIPALKDWCNKQIEKAYVRQIKQYTSKFNSLCEYSTRLRRNQGVIAKFEYERMKGSDFSKDKERIDEYKKSKGSIDILMSRISEEILKVREISTIDLFDSMSIELDQRITYKHLATFQDECPDFIKEEVQNDNNTTNDYAL